MLAQDECAGKEIIMKELKPMETETMEEEMMELPEKYEGIGGDLSCAGYEWEEDYKEITGYYVTLYGQPYYSIGDTWEDLRDVKYVPVEDDDETPVEEELPVVVKPIDEPVVNPVDDSTEVEPIDDTEPVVSPVEEQQPIEEEKPSDKIVINDKVDNHKVTKPVSIPAASAETVSVDASSSSNFVSPVNFNNLVSINDVNVKNVSTLLKRDLENQCLLMNAAAASNGKTARELDSKQVVINNNSGNKVATTFNLNTESAYTAADVGTKVKAVCWNETDLDYVIEGVVVAPNKVVLDNFILRNVTNVTIYIEE